MKNPPLDEILIECAFHLGKGVADAEIDPEAFAAWMDDYRKSFGAALRAPGSYWQRDKRKVLPLALKLGKVAVALAAKDAITVDVALKASEIIKQDPSCPRQLPRGRYCA